MARKKKLQEMDRKPIVKLHVYIEYAPERFVQKLEVSYIQQNYTINSYKPIVSYHKNIFLLKLEPKKNFISSQLSSAFIRGAEDVLHEVKHMHGHILLLTVKHDQSLEMLCAV
jgi:hypothetical protein